MRACVICADLDHALSCLSREDPSLRVTVNEETGQTVLSGMGELHLEIVHDRLARDYGVDCSLGKLQVAYREAPTVAVTKEGEYTVLLESRIDQEPQCFCLNCHKLCRLCRECNILKRIKKCL